MTSERNAGYSTLEVDEEAQARAAKQARLGNAPEAYTTEAQKDTSAPQVPFSDLPEAFQPHKGAVQAHAPRARLVCGLKKRTFYIILGFLALIVIGAAVGGGVGGSLSGKSLDNSPSNATNPTNTSTSPPPANTSTSLPPGSLLPTTSLASINYTDGAGTDYYLVYYQLASKAICQSLWNASNNTWTASVVTNDTDNIMENTPISADLWWNSPSDRNIDVYWLQPNKLIRGVTSLRSGPWGVNGINDKYSATAIASYAKECFNCYDNNVVVYIGSDPNLQILQTKTRWSQDPFDNSFPSPADGSDVALKPVYTRNDDDGYMVIFMQPTEGGNLTQIFWDGRYWASYETLPTSLSANASIAAFTAGHNDTSDSDYTAQVLTTDPSGTTGSVTLTAYNSTNHEWTSTRGVAGFEDLLNNSALAASQAGRVYGIVEGADGEANIAEWAWSANDWSYSRVGDVATLDPES